MPTTPSECVAGCDPGLSGSIAFWSGPDSTPLVYDLPLCDDYREVDGVALLGLLNDFSPRLVMLELVQGFRGASAAFKLGQSYGTIIVATLSARIRLERVRPQTWQKAILGTNSGNRRDTKAASVAHVRAAFPKADLRRPGVRYDHNRADAICLAEYAHATLAQ